MYSCSRHTFLTPYPYELHHAETLIPVALSNPTILVDFLSEAVLVKHFRIIQFIYIILTCSVKVNI